MAEGKFYTIDFLPVGSTTEETSDHKVLVNLDDSDPNYLFDKQAPTSQIGFINDTQNPGKFLVLLDKNNPDDDGQGIGLMRTITPFSPQQIDDEYIGLAGNQNESRVIVFPITISIGAIKAFSFITKSQNDINGIDRIQLAILSNTNNHLPGSKLEFLAQYGFGDANDNLELSSDGRTWKLYDDSTFSGIYDLNCNYHFVVFYIHFTDNNMGLLAKNRSTSPLVEIGRNTNYCGQENNQTTILREDFINPTTHTVPSTYSLQTNLQTNFPYIEFYQVRGS